MCARLYVRVTVTHHHQYIMWARERVVAAHELSASLALVLLAAREGTAPTNSATRV